MWRLEAVIGRGKIDVSVRRSNVECGEVKVCNRIDPSRVGGGVRSIDILQQGASVRQ